MCLCQNQAQIFFFFHESLAAVLDGAEPEIQNVKCNYCKYLKS